VREGERVTCPRGHGSVRRAPLKSEDGAVFSRAVVVWFSLAAACSPVANTAPWVRGTRGAAETLDEPAALPLRGLPRSARAQARPREVAGLAFGMTRAEVRAACPNSLPVEDSIVCAPNRSLLGFDAQIAATFCDGRACMFMVARDRDEETSDLPWLQMFDALRDDLITRFGQPSRIARIIPAHCEGQGFLACLRRGEASYRLFWAWSERPLAGVVLTFEQPEPGAPDSLLLVYQDEAGVLRELQRARPQGESF
jgi:hypothetical protein